MGLFDQVVRAFTGVQGSPAVQGLLSQLGGQEGSADTAQSPNSAVMNIVSRFQQAGLGDVVESWIGNGPNQSVSPEQVHSALGDDHVQAMSQQSGLSTHDLLRELAQSLPKLIDGMTPQGKLPSQPPAPEADQA